MQGNKSCRWHQGTFVDIPMRILEPCLRTLAGPTERGFSSSAGSSSLVSQEEKHKLDYGRSEAILSYAGKR